MMQKAENAAAASLRSIVDRRGRNADLAEEAVRESAAFSAKEALEGGLIDSIVVDSAELIATLDGSTITRFNGEEVTLELRGESINRIEMGLRQKILSVLVDPNLTFLLMSLGMLGLYVEFTHPGLIFPGPFALLVSFPSRKMTARSYSLRMRIELRK